MGVVRSNGNKLFVFLNCMITIYLCVFYKKRFLLLLPVILRCQYKYRAFFQRWQINKN
jgi:hypothetical protein